MYDNYSEMTLEALEAAKDELLGAISNEQMWMRNSADREDMMMHKHNLLDLEDELDYVLELINEKE